MDHDRFSAKSFRPRLTALLRLKPLGAPASDQPMALRVSHALSNSRSGDSAHRNVRSDPAYEAQMDLDIFATSRDNANRDLFHDLRELSVLSRTVCRLDQLGLATI